MFFVLLLLFTVVPIVEIALLVKLGSWLGFWAALGLVLGTGVVGAALARWQGFRAVTKIQQQLAQGGLPTTEISDGLMILVAGLMLITPGAVTDLCGLALLVPPVRTLIRRAVTGWLKRHVRVEQFPDRRSPSPSSPQGERIIDAEVVETRTFDADSSP